jgi:hypothetical protein
MGKQDYYQQKSYEEIIDFIQQGDDDEHLVQFEHLIFDELLCYIKDKVLFAAIISNDLVHDGAKVFNNIDSNSLKWLRTADRKNIYGITVYSFRFGNPCHPDCYTSFITGYHSYFALSNQIRHDLQGWYKYTGLKLPKEIEKYLNIFTVMEKQYHYKTKIFVNNKHERLDIEFHFQCHGSYQRITITFEPGYPAVIR